MTASADIPFDDETQSEMNTATDTDSDAPEGPGYDDTGNEPVDEETRKKVLDEYNHRCQICGRRDPEHGGLAALQVHHIERDPTGMDEHDLENLTVLCRSCHSWIHNRSTIDDSPVELTADDRNRLLPQDIEILQYLKAEGPARTGDVVDAVSVDQTVTALRERLWTLMGLDNMVESRERQIVDKDVETGEWGLTEQIENSSRGHIPDDPQMLLQRMEDEQVRQALERGCARETIADVLGTTRRTTFTKEKRALAIDFPLEAFNRGGRPSTSNTIGDEQPVETESRDEAAQTELGETKSEAEPAQHTDNEDPILTDGEESPGVLSDDADPVEVWNRNHDRPYPVQLTPHVSDLATELEPKELQEQLPENITPIQVINALLTSPRS